MKLMYKSIVICGLAGLFYCYEYLLRIAPNVMLNDIKQAFSISAANVGHWQLIFIMLIHPYSYQQAYS